jgi:hypothetical protein
MSWYFTDEEESYLKDNYTTKTLYQMSLYLQRPRSSVGYHLQTVLQLKVPAAVILDNRKQRKEAADKKHADHQAEKQLLKALKKQHPAVKKVMIKTSPAKKLPAVVRTYKIDKPIKKPQPAAIKIPCTTGLIPQRVDHKTVLYLKPGADVTCILKQYQKKII